MATIELSLNQLDDPHITLELDLSQELSSLDINLDDDDIDEAMSEDPVRCLTYLLNYHWDSDMAKGLVEVLTEVLSAADLLSLSCALTSKKESAA